MYSNTPAAETYEEIINHLAAITVLVARYTVMENIYRQSPEMMLETEYDFSLVDLGVEVLRYLETLHEYKYDHNRKTALTIDVMRELVGNINIRDVQCRAFGVTIVQDTLNGTLQEIRGESSDSEDSEECEDE